MKTYLCNACGANMILNDNASFTTCLYCGNNIAICDKAFEDLNIKKIIPFEIEKEEAINNFKKILKETVVDAKKVYVPVRLCNYDFDFQMYYQYEVRDSDDNRSTYYDTEDLIDGRVEKDFVFGNSKVNDVYCQNELRKRERLNFDPILLKDVSIEYSDFSSRDNIVNKINDDVYHYSYGKIRNKRNVSSIYSMNYYASDLEIDDYSTLIPVYIVKTSNGLIYNMPGVKLTRALKSNKTKNIIFSIIGIIMLLFLIWILINIGSKDIHKQSTMYALLVLYIPIAAVVILLYRRGLNISKKTYDNFDYNIYSFGNNRKKIK